MKKYPFSPELLDALPEGLAELYRGLEDELLTMICSRLNISGQLNEVTVQTIRALRSHGIGKAEIDRAIKRTAKVSEKELVKLYDDVVARNQAYYTDLIDIAKVTHPETLVTASDIAAIYAQTRQEMENITRTMAFLVDGGRTKLPPQKAFTWACDSALMQVQSGAVSYDKAVENAVKQLADSGLKIVDYESGHTDQVDVAARRAVMTGVSQLCAKYTEQTAEYLGTPYYEVSAHAGARDKAGASPWSSHKDWQGKVYSTRSGDIYPNIYAVCGLGYVDGLEGANCRHIRNVWVEGVSERTYTDEQLANIDNPPFEYDGRTYTTYEATQMQRRMERTMRKLKRQEASYKASGSKEAEQAVNIRMRRLNAKYKAFSKAAGLREQPQRMKVYNPTSITSGKIEPMSVDKSILTSVNEKKDVHYVGRIDIEKYNVVTKDIRTDEVIITDERIKHIQDRHPNDFDKYAKYMEDIVKDPQYILETNRPNTAFLLKEYADGKENIQLILRLATSSDNKTYKNSVITFLKVEKKRYKRYIRTKKILYKKD